MTRSITVSWLAAAGIGSALTLLGVLGWSASSSDSAELSPDPQIASINQAGAATRSAAPDSTEPKAGQHQAKGKAKPKTSAKTKKRTEPRADGPEEKTSSASGLEVKRLVVTTGIEDREPIETKEFRVGSGPTFAFVELENQSSDDDTVIVTFTHESGKKVGHVRLRVPGDSKRWRTWAKTKLIDRTGKWAATVKTLGGKPIASQAFQVVDRSGQAEVDSEEHAD